MEERYIASVDLGTSKLAVCVASIEDQNVQIIYYKESPSEGIRNSRVTNPGIADKFVRNAIAEAQQTLRIKIQQVVVGLPRWQVRQETASASAEREDDSRFISESEIRFLKSEALKTYPLSDSKRDLIYGAVAQSYSTEDCINEPESEIIGMSAEKIEGKFKVFIGSKRLSTNLDELFGSMQIGIARKFFIPGITAKAVLSSEEMKNGVALVDIGAGVSSVTIFKDNLMRYYAAIPFGGDCVTRDIESICGFSFKMAEEIKKAYGACLPAKLSTLGEKELHIMDDDGRLLRKLSIKVLSEIVNARMEEIINALLYKIQESGLSSEDYLKKGIVVTGGGAEMLNCVNLFKDLSGYSVKLGLPKKYVSCDGCPEASEASASTAIGMILAVKGDKSINCINDVTFRPSQRSSGSQSIQDNLKNQEVTKPDDVNEYKPDSNVSNNVQIEEPDPVNPEESPIVAAPLDVSDAGEDTNKPEGIDPSGEPEPSDGNWYSGEDGHTVTPKPGTTGSEQPVTPGPDGDGGSKPGPEPEPKPKGKNPLVKFFWRLYDNVQKDVND